VVVSPQDLQSAFYVLKDMSRYRVLFSIDYTLIDLPLPYTVGFRGFRRVAGHQLVPPNTVAYHHNLFRKGKPELLEGMHGGGKRKNQDDIHTLDRREFNRNLSPLDYVYDPTRAMLQQYSPSLSSKDQRSSSVSSAGARVLPRQGVLPEELLLDRNSSLLGACLLREKQQITGATPAGQQDLTALQLVSILRRQRQDQDQERLVIEAIASRQTLLQQIASHQLAYGLGLGGIGGLGVRLLGGGPLPTGAISETDPLLNYILRSRPTAAAAATDGDCLPPATTALIRLLQQQEQAPQQNLLPDHEAFERLVQAATALIRLLQQQRTGSSAAAAAPTRPGEV
jgi:hypothetical protein